METPNLNKLYEHGNDIKLCTEFLEWFCMNYTVFKTNHAPEPVYTGSGDYINIEKVVHNYFCINDEEVEKERQAVLNKVTSNITEMVDVTDNADYADVIYKKSGAIKLFLCSREVAQKYIEEHYSSTYRIVVTDDNTLKTTIWWRNESDEIAIYDSSQNLLAIYIMTE